MYPNGLYKVNDKLYGNKITALLEATKNHSKLEWIFYDDVFEISVLMHKRSSDIKELYKTRALQLREKYDYLILNYSGGSDSHNILHVFLENNILLDHIYVQWPLCLMDKNLYHANRNDTSNFNFHSEWDLVLKKDLEWISIHYPNIKIEIDDWVNNIKENFYKDVLFTNNVTNLPSIARSQKQNNFSQFETDLVSKGLRVGSIYGVDKPNIVKKEDQWFFYFVDTGCMAQPNPENPYGLEYFYWSVDLPAIPIEQAYLVKEWFEKNPNMQYLIEAKSQRSMKDETYTSWPYHKHYKEWALTQEIIKSVCYPYWDFNRFQADKPFSILDGLKMGVRPWDNILHNIPNFSRIQQIWEYNWNSYIQEIDLKLMRSKDTFAVVNSKWHLLC